MCQPNPFVPTLHGPVQPISGSRDNLGTSRANSNAAIANGDPQNVLQEITGLATSGLNLTSAHSDRDPLRNAVNSGQRIGVGSFSAFNG
ncbi:MAG TPA: hypothetical protein VKU02_25430 [Gemmataceae bacterium]|nr:hypothetical protein [Gemmataceae bacterium]